MAERVFIGLGANLNDPQQQIIDALNCLKLIPESSLLQHSSLYCSKPLGPKEQPNYVNAVALIETTLTPTTLKLLRGKKGRLRKPNVGDLHLRPRYHIVWTKSDQY